MVSKKYINVHVKNDPAKTEKKTVFDHESIRQILLNINIFWLF